MSSLVLLLRDFSVRIGDKLILDRINLDIGQQETLVIMGPGGAGKSTLLRTICGLNDSNQALRVNGIANYLSAPVGGSERPVLVEQNPQMMISTGFEFLARSFPERSAHTRLEMCEILTQEFVRYGIEDEVDCLNREMLSMSKVQRRLLMLLAAQLSRPDLLCVDEPTSGLDDTQARPILEFLDRQSQERSILMVTHNQRHGRQLSDYTALLAGGKIFEHLPTEEFFFNPQSQLTQTFIRTGSCTVASPESRPQELAPCYTQKQPFVRSSTPADIPSLRSRDHDNSSISRVPSERRGPYGFHWMRPGRTAGTPMPGVVRPIEEDLQALRRVEVTLLITLTRMPLSNELLASYDLEAIHFPIVDMHPPSLEEARQLCRTVDDRLDAGDVIAFHCRAGIGRTGTMLAAYEIWKGMSADEAFEAARSVHSRWIQSQAQRQFLTEFERWLE